MQPGGSVLFSILVSLALHRKLGCVSSIARVYMRPAMPELSRLLIMVSSYSCVNDAVYMGP